MSNETYDWCNFYNFAKEFSDSDNPTELRIGISRFYYSAFCKCRDYIIENNLFLDKKCKNTFEEESSEVHNEVRNVFYNNSRIDKKYGKKIARALSDVREKRNKADYDSNNYKFRNDYDFVKAKVEMIFAYLDKL